MRCRLCLSESGSIRLYSYYKIADRIKTNSGNTHPPETACPNAGAMFLDMVTV